MENFILLLKYRIYGLEYSHGCPIENNSKKN